MIPTREGRRYVIALLFIALAAFNTGNNLIFLILALMLSTAVTAVVFLTVNLRGISISADLTGPFYSGISGYLYVIVRNSKKRAPSYSLTVKTPIDYGGNGNVAAFIGAAGSAEMSLPVIFPRRGIYPLDGIIVESSFPFGLLSRNMRPKLTGHLTVYPQIIDLGDDLAESSTGPSGARTIHGRGEEFHMIRGYLTGDDIRRVSWKATAKTGGLMVREYGREIGGLITVTLDDTGTAASGDFERAVSYAASAVKLYMDQGFLLRLVTSVQTIPFGSGPAHLYKILDHLAIVQEGQGGPRLGNDDDIGGLLVLKGRGSVLEAQRGNYERVVYAEDL